MIINNTYFDYSSFNNLENLSIEEAILNSIDKPNLSTCSLRFWESPSYFVVLGRSNKSSVEVNESVCSQKNIPILKRCSGGGTVLQGPGCLNYALIQTIDSNTENITLANNYVMGKVKEAISMQCSDIHIKGYTDLTQGNVKFSGNAQKRKRYAFLFHGTILYNFNLNLVEEVLAFPSKWPSYREKRSHINFIKNIKCDVEQFKNDLAKLFNCNKKISFPDVQSFLNFQR